ncbi:MAG: hypothetical protein KF712_07140 [Akkermansiaceae bacterium]|nr:hypothetical protein [Akkermansiaceae bacterium]
MKRLLLSLIALFPGTPAFALTLQSGEWFLNGDPGRGSGTSFSLPSSVTASRSVAIPASALNGLGEGVHLLGVRLRDSEGRWGHAVWRTFYKKGTPEAPPPVVSLAYQISRGGATVADGTVAATTPGGQVTIPVSHGNDGLQLDAQHLVQVFPVDALGRRGHAVTVPFTFKRYVQVWQEEHFTTAERNNPAVSGDDADPDKDGLTNAQERFFALDPRNAGDSGLAAVWIGQQADASGTNRPARAPAGGAPWSLSFRVPAGGTVGEDGIYRTSDLHYTLRHNTDLGSWDAIPSSWLAGWSLHDLGDGAARLRMEVMPDASGKRFFSLEGAR